MSLADDYRRAARTLRELDAAGRKITLQARHRIAAKSLREQLTEHMRQLREDQADIAFALDADHTEDKLDMVQPCPAARNAKGWESTP